MNVQLAKNSKVTPNDLLKPLRTEETKKKMRKDKKHLEQVVKKRKEVLHHGNDIS